MAKNRQKHKAPPETGGGKLRIIETTIEAVAKII
jgi:hypothetical protein